MAATFTKGTEVFAVHHVDGKGLVAIQRLVIEACGKKVIKATKNGSFIKRQYDQSRVNTEDYGSISGYVWLFEAACTDIDSEAKKLGDKFIEAWVKQGEQPRQTPELKYV